MDSGLSKPDPVTQIANILAPAARSAPIYMQTGINRTSTRSQVAAKLQIDATIQAAYPDNYVLQLHARRRHGRAHRFGRWRGVAGELLRRRPSSIGRRSQRAAWPVFRCASVGIVG